MKKKFSIDVKTARQLEDMRVTNNWSWKQLYAYFLGMGIEQAEAVNPLDADALRKQVERKKDRASNHEKQTVEVLRGSDLSTERTVSYEVKDDEIKTATGTVYLDRSLDHIGEDASRLVKALFTEFNLSEKDYTLVKYSPSYVNGRFKVWARFERRAYNPYNEDEVVQRYQTTLLSLGTAQMEHIYTVETDNLFVLNLADVHWNKLPHTGYDGQYLAQFEQDIYDSVARLLARAKHSGASRAIITLGHDFFQTNDHRGTTKKGTPVSHILEYKDMFDGGVRILANVIYMVAKQYVTDCYYVLANHDDDAGWHASRELKLMYSKTPHINVIVDKMPFHYVEWGNTLIELTHENVKSGRGYSNMPVTAREAWGRTKYHYSIGGHLHGEYTTKENRGIVVMGSRSISDTDEWHIINGYIGNLRGVQGYLFNKDEGLIATINANL